MNIIGIRAKPDSVTFAVLDNQNNVLLNIEVLKIPKALNTPDALKYVRNNILDILNEYQVKRAGVRITESNAQRPDHRRIALEGVIQESFASSNLESYYCGQISNISARVGINRAEFKPLVDGTTEFPSIENWTTLTKEAREAVLTAIGAQND